MINVQESPMAVDEEPFITMNDAAGMNVIMASKRGKRVHLATLHRWIRQGCGGVKLRAMKMGQVWVTKRSWVMEFFEALTARAPKFSPGPNKAAQLKNEKELRAAGALK